MGLSDQLAAELYRHPVVHGHLLDPAPDPVARLQHEDVCPRTHEIAGRCQAGETGTEDGDVGQAAPSSDAASTRSASAGRCTATLSPRWYGNACPAFASNACTIAPLGVRTMTCVVEPR